MNFKKIISSAILIILIIQISAITLATESDTSNLEKENIPAITASEDNSEENNEGLPTIEANENEDNKEWGDFSKAEITLSKDGNYGACIEISKIVTNDNNSYYMYISNNADTNYQDIEKNKEDVIYLHIDKEKNKCIVKDGKIAEKIELNQDLYCTIVEKQIKTGVEKIVLSPKKLLKFDEAKNYDAFFATYMSYDSTQIITTFTHHEKNTRKLQIKIGKITDNQILKKIQEKNESGFSDLMNYAKLQNNSLYDNVSIVENNSNGIRHVSSEEAKVIQLKGLENKEYYYLYVKADDENGKYIYNEAVTLAQSSTFENGNWYLFFYGTNDFKWKEFGTTDPTTAGSKYPNTGKIAIGTGIVSLIGATYVFHRKNKKYQDIK